METKDTIKRSRTLLAVIMLVIVLGATVLMPLTNQAPPGLRLILGLGVLALFTLPIGFLYGRNSARKDQFRIIARIALCLVIAFLIYSLSGPKKLNPFTALSGGFLLGFLIGWGVSRLSQRQYGDTIEADQFLNAFRSEPVVRPQEDYLKSLDPFTREAIKRVQTAEVTVVLGATAVGLLLFSGDYFEPLSRALFVNPGDGTRFFITPEPILGVFPLVALFLCICVLVLQKLPSRLTGANLDAWREYTSLRESRKRSSLKPETARKVALVMAIVSLIAFALFIDTYVNVTNNGIRISEFLEVGSHFYRWDQIRDVQIDTKPYVCDKGHTHQQFVARVIFKDGREWNPDRFQRRAALNEAAVRFVADRWRE